MSQCISLWKPFRQTVSYCLISAGLILYWITMSFKYHLDTANALASEIRTHTMTSSSTVRLEFLIVIFNSLGLLACHQWTRPSILGFVGFLLPLSWMFLNVCHGNFLLRRKAWPIKLNLQPIHFLSLRSPPTNRLLVRMKDVLETRSFVVLKLIYLQYPN